MKLKHRITGTILAIVFATTSILPAATIPQLKSPPKTVSAPKVPVVKVPVVKVPTAPKVPVVKVPTVPKIPQVAKVPTVKVPSVKVPVMPKIVKVPDAPKIPVAPKLMKAPSAPKVPQAAKAPVIVSRRPVVTKVPAAAKVPAASSGKTNAAVSKLVVANPVIIQKTAVKLDPIKGIVRDARRDNPETPPDVGVDSKLPGKGLPGRGNLLGGSKLGTATDKNSQEMFDARSGKGGTVKGIFDGLLPARETPALTDKSNIKAAFDQGFSSKPDAGEMNRAAESSGIGANPVSVLTGGGGFGSFLSSTSATDSTATTSKGGAVGSGMVGKFADNTRSVAGVAAGGIAFGAAPAGVAASEAFGAGVFSTGTVTAAGAAGLVLAAGLGGFELGTLINDNLIGDSLVDWAEKNLPPLPAWAGGAGMPDPENTQGRFSVYDLSPGIVRQIGQSRSGGKVSQGGSGDATPVDGGGIGGVVTTGGLPGNLMQNLLGNPAGQGLRETGAGKAGPNFNGAAGQINLGPDGVVTNTAGSVTEDPGDFFGNNGVSPSRPVNAPPANNGSEDEDSGSSSSTNSDSKKKEK